MATASIFNLSEVSVLSEHEPLRFGPFPLKILFNKRKQKLYREPEQMPTRYKK